METDACENCGRLRAERDHDALFVEVRELRHGNAGLEARCDELFAENAALRARLPPEAVEIVREPAPPQGVLFA